MKYYFPKAVRCLTIAVILLVLVGAFSACKSGASTTPPTTPSVEWIPDGVITNGEYSNSASLGNNEMTVAWRTDSQYIYIGMSAPTLGWISIGLIPSTGSQKQGADMMFGYVKSDGTTMVYDLYNTGPLGPHTNDTNLGGTFDILDNGGKEANGITTVEFKRKLNTGDQYDLPFNHGTNHLIWAIGRVDEVTATTHYARGYADISIS